MSKSKKKKKAEPGFIDPAESHKEKRQKLWSHINHHFNLVKAEDLSIFIEMVKPNYQYFEDFISFAKNKDAKVCMTSIPKGDLLGAAQRDIEQCLDAYCNNSKVEYPILYVEYFFKDDKHGFMFQDVYLMFLCESEEKLLDLFFKFEKLKVFL